MIKYTVFQSKYNPNAWLVLCADEAGASEDLVSFTGGNAETLAKEYATWKTQQLQITILRDTWKGTHLERPATDILLQQPPTPPCVLDDAGGSGSPDGAAADG